MKLYVIFSAILLSLSLVGCVGVDGGGNALNGDLSRGIGNPLPGPGGELPTPGSPPRSYTVGALIYNGSGTASDDTASITGILSSKGVTYQVVSSSQMNSLTDADLGKFGVIIWPGGTAKTMSDSLTSSTRARIKAAVVNAGVGFVGFCAGAFVAGTYGSWGLEIASQDFPYYYLENQGVERRMVDVEFPDGRTRNLLWYGGPELANFGNVIARYPDSTSAIAEERIGQGLVILSGPHPEAPQSWKSGYNDTDGPDLDLAWTLINAAMKNTPLATY